MWEWKPYFTNVLEFFEILDFSLVYLVPTVSCECYNKLNGVQRIKKIVSQWYSIVFNDNFVGFWFHVLFFSAKLRWAKRRISHSFWIQKKKKIWKKEKTLLWYWSPHSYSHSPPHYIICLHALVWGARFPWWFPLSLQRNVQLHRCWWTLLMSNLCVEEKKLFLGVLSREICNKN